MFVGFPKRGGHPFFGPTVWATAERGPLGRGEPRRFARMIRGGLVEAEESPDSEEEAVGRILFADGGGGVGGQSRAALVDGVAECFY